jgi:hypothetical protein
VGEDSLGHSVDRRLLAPMSNFFAPVTICPKVLMTNTMVPFRDTGLPSKEFG